MNTYYLIAGILLAVTGTVHMVLGELWIFRKLKAENLETHYTGDVTKTTLRWFWHVGSFIVYFVGTLAFLMALTDDIVPAEGFVGILCAIIYLGINSLLVVVNMRNPLDLRHYPQLIVMIGIMVLLYLGSQHSLT